MKRIRSSVYRAARSGMAGIPRLCSNGQLSAWWIKALSTSIIQKKNVYGSSAYALMIYRRSASTDYCWKEDRTIIN
jgi:hypothetical protein